jgi:TP901 family phage tail tape measure protein
MTTQPVEANVVLTADNSQYDQAMLQSAGSTNSLGQAVDTLGGKISKMTKTAGKSLIGIAAADIALITAATAAWASYEKQVSRLQAQAAILGRGREQETRLMKDYTASVKAMRTEFGTSTTEAAKLTETLSKVTSPQQSRNLTDLSKVFTQMSKATGESSQGLASSLTNLQKIMGSPINTKETQKYADMFTHLSAQTNTSAQGLIDFTAQLAPMAESMGMNTKQVAGFATAFAKAGQEGMGASTVFTKITTDITKSLSTGSSEVAHYANLVGESVESFKKMEGAEQVVRILEALQSQGAGAASELNRLGLDGPRSIRAIQAVTREAGSVRGALGMAEAGAVSGASAEGAEAAMKGISDEMEKLAEQSKMLGETMGTWLAPAVEKFVIGMTKAMEIVNKIAEGPLGKFMQLVMGVIAPLAAGGGAMLIFAGTLLKVAAAFAAIRSSATRGAVEGFQGGSGMTRMPDGSFVARGEGTLGKRGAQIAEGGRWTQAAMYNVGQFGGAAFGGGAGAIREAWMGGREKFDPNYQRPTTSRGPLSYLAGGFGRAMQMAITPQFDQMRYPNPADRTPMFGERFAQMAPMAGVRSFFGAGGEGSARAEGMADVVKNIKTETEARINNTQATRMNLDATQAQTRAVKDSSVGFTRLARGLGGGALGAAGAVLGGARAAGGALYRSPFGAPIAGMGATAAVSGLGIESNAAMLGAMGLSFGAGGAAVGAGIGFGIDIVQHNKDVEESLANLNSTAEETAKTGLGLAGMDEEAIRTQKAVDDLDQKFKDTGGGLHQWFTHPIAKGAGLKNYWEGVFGASDVEELQADQDKANATLSSSEDTIRALAETTGTVFTGGRENQLKQMEEFMATTGAARLGEADITMRELTAARKGGLGNIGFAVSRAVQGEQPMTYEDMLNKIATGMGKDVQTRLIEGGGTGRTMATSKTAQDAMKFQDDVALFYEASNEIFSTAREQGKGYLQIMKEAEEAQHEIGDENDRGYELQMAVAQKAQQGLAMQMQVGTRAEQFQGAMGQMQVLGGITPTTPEQAQQLEGMKTQTASVIADQVNYFKQLLLAQDQYELQRGRAQDDYHLQRTYQEYDFNLQRSRAEENFNRMRGRATADFHRGQRRAYFDYNLQRDRQEQDFNHNVEVMAKQAATSIYSIYDRVQTERTSSASWLLANAQDQLTRMQEQATNLDALRKRGLSDTAIQQLGLTDPQNAQQLARFMTEMTPQMIRQFNRTAGTERVKAARDLVTDQSSLEFQEMTRGYRRARRQMAEDFERQMRLSKQDFRRGMREQSQDFDIMMDQQAEDYQTGMERQEKAYKKQMDRSAEDMANMANEISLSMEEVLEQSAARLSGNAKTQATAVLTEFRKMKRDTTPEAIDLMEDLAMIFGFKYEAPRGIQQPASYGAGWENNPGANPHLPENRADGGTVPGWTPGRDVTTVNVSGGEAIMRPEWARAVGEGAINAANHQAKYGGFASGGVFWPVPGRDTGTYAGHDGVDINRGSGSDDMGDPIRAFRSGKITYVGYDHGYGQAIFQSTAAGNVVYGHTSAVNVHAGQQVAGGQLIGAVGSTGNSSAPHLHFGIPGGTYSQAMALLQGAMVGRFAGATTASLAQLADVLKDRYPNAERAAGNMGGVRPLDPGDISSIINRFARRKLRRLRRRYGMADIGAEGADIGNQPNENLNNQEIVRTGATRLGWGNQWNDLYQLVMHESGFNNLAQNPTSTAYGMFQFLDSTWAGTGIRKTSDPWKQTQAGLKYIKNRYTDPKGAWDFWQANNWYGDGAVFDKATQIGVGEKGPEAVIPLNARGADFMTDVMGSVMGGRNVGRVGGGMSVFNTRIDRSTNFTGPITVQANDPMELIGKLKARQRVMALSRPSLTGSAA